MATNRIETLDPALIRPGTAVHGTCVCTCTFNFNRHLLRCVHILCIHSVLFQDFFLHVQ